MTTPSSPARRWWRSRLAIAPAVLLLVGVATAIVVLAGCSSGDRPVGGHPTASSSAAPTTAAVSVGQYASVVSKHAADVHAAAQNMRLCDPVQPDVGCQAAADTARFTADALATELGALPPAPAEVAVLAGETLDAARLAAQPPTAGAAGWINFAAAVDVLVRQLDGWAPYGAVVR